jgi:hypothetical protein
MRDQVLDYCATEYNEKELFIGKQFDTCIIGICYDMPSGFTPAYDLDKILAILMKKKKLTEDEAIKYFNIEILDKNPVISFIKTSNETPDVLSEYNNSMLFLDGYPHNCIIGIRIKKDTKIVAAYSDADCVDSLIEDDEMTDEDAVEFFEYNTRGSYVGEHTPVFVTLFF